MSSLIPIESYATEADLQYALDLIDELKEKLTTAQSTIKTLRELKDIYAESLFEDTEA